MNEDILRFCQDTARGRGYPPFAIEVTRQFEMEMSEAQNELGDVKRHLLNVTRTIERPRQNHPDVMNAVLPPMSLPSAPAGINLERFQGRNGWPDSRDRMIYWLDAATNIYLRGSVDYVLHDEQIALTPETEKWLYSADSARLPTYRRGSRPFLEKVVAEQAAGCATDRAKGMALVRLFGEAEKNPYGHRNSSAKPFFGGREEEVIRKVCNHWRMCNEISRALSFLCQVAGLPARPVFCYTDPLVGVPGHTLTEIFFDGKWNAVEQNYGLLFMMPDGYFASVVELRDKPEIVNARCDVGYHEGLCHAVYTGPISILPYTIDNTEHYEYPWQN